MLLAKVLILNSFSAPLRRQLLQRGENTQRTGSSLRETKKFI